MPDFTAIGIASPIENGSSPIGGNSRRKAGVRQLPIQNGGNPVTGSVLLNDGTNTGATTGQPGGAQLIVAAAGNNTRARLTIVNNSAAAIEIGGQGFLWGKGIPIAAGGSYSETDNESAWYGLAAPTKTADVRFLVLEYI